MLSAQYGWIYSSQPAVRAVVDYIATNAAQLGPAKLFERVGPDERRDAGDHPAAETLRHPNPMISGVGFMASALSDLLVYDNAFALKMRPNPGEALELYPLPADSVGLIGPSRFSVDAFRIHRVDGTWFDVPPADMIHWHGYNPEDPRLGLSKLETLRTQLAEESASQRAQIELAKSGLNQLGHIERPLEAPEWSEEGADRFREDYTNQMRQGALRYPVLEEGMKFVPSQMSPKDAEMLASREFTREEVARAYGMKHVPPEGDEERMQFYGDVLPPILDDWCAVLNLALVQVEFGDDELYFEVSLDEKLQGDERLKALVSASGAAVITRNEARARLNLPPLPEGDGLVTPLNVLVGDNPKPSPQVMPPQNPLGPAQDGSAREDNPQGAAMLGEGKRSAVTDALLGYLKRRGSNGSDKNLNRYTRELRNDLAAAGLEDADLAAAMINEGLTAALEKGERAEVYRYARREAPKLAARWTMDVEQLKALGVPEEVLWERAGFSRDEIDRMRALKLAEGLGAGEG